MILSMHAIKRALPDIDVKERRLLRQLMLIEMDRALEASQEASECSAKLAAVMQTASGQYLPEPAEVAVSWVLAWRSFDANATSQFSQKFIDKMPSLEECTCRSIDKTLHCRSFECFGYS